MTHRDLFSYLRLPALWASGIALIHIPLTLYVELHRDLNVDDQLVAMMTFAEAMRGLAIAMGASFLIALLIGVIGQSRLISPRSFKAVLITALAIGCLVGGFMTTVAILDERGEYVDFNTGAIDYGHLLGLFYCWFAFFFLGIAFLCLVFLLWIGFETRRESIRRPRA